ncbi:MAG: ACT domain-containing protein [Acidobacteriia bacterium]|nr:ACT domain-containing protein [Terriglobia bacterium]
MRLEVLRGEFGVARLDANEATPAWAAQGIISSVTRTAEELSVVCTARVSIFSISTYDTDYVLVEGEAMGRAIECLHAAGLRCWGRERLPQLLARMAKPGMVELDATEQADEADEAVRESPAAR